jgi:hypothetical protein
MYPEPVEDDTTPGTPSTNIGVMSFSETTTRPNLFVRLEITWIALFLALALLAPYVVHFIPSWDDSPIGAKLLPIFYAPLIAALTRKSHVSIVVAVMAPWLNHALIGMPSLFMAVIMTVELVIFSVFVERLARIYKGKAWLGPVCYLLAKPVSLAILLLIPGFLSGTPSLTRFAMSVVNAWPGLAILALLSYYIPRKYPPGAAPA